MLTLSLPECLKTSYPSRHNELRMLLQRVQCPTQRNQQSLRLTNHRNWSFTTFNLKFHLYIHLIKWHNHRPVHWTLVKENNLPCDSYCQSEKWYIHDLWKLNADYYYFLLLLMSFICLWSKQLRFLFSTRLKIITTRAIEEQLAKFTCNNDQHYNYSQSYLLPTTSELQSYWNIVNKMKGCRCKGH